MLLLHLKSASPTRATTEDKLFYAYQSSCAITSSEGAVLGFYLHMRQLQQ